MFSAYVLFSPKDFLIYLFDKILNRLVQNIIPHPSILVVKTIHKNKFMFQILFNNSCEYFMNSFSDKRESSFCFLYVLFLFSLIKITLIVLVPVYDLSLFIPTTILEEIMLLLHPQHFVNKSISLVLMIYLPT